MTEEYNFEKIKAIVGLGNPGAKYYKTRHNIGFRIVDAFVDRYHASWSEKDFAEHTQILISEVVVNVVKPLTFMNSSGSAIPFLLNKGIKANQILVVHDELEKSFGKMDIRFGGSARGHNGLRSIQGVIGKDFWRLRFGIGRPEDKSQVGDYVLSKFLPEEELLIQGLVEEAITIIDQA